MKDYAPATSDVQLVDEFSHFQEFPEDQLKEHFLDEISISVWGTAGDKDVMLVCTIYHVGGRLWGIEDTALIQTVLLLSPRGDRVMRNNDFVGNRMDQLTHFDNFEVVQEADKVIWKAGNRQIICRPPYWELKGEHLGVDIDIKVSGIGTAVPYHGTWDGLVARGLAGNEHLVRAEGSFTYNGETYTLDEGWGVRERICFGKDWDLAAVMGSGYIWGWCFSDAVKVFCFAQSGSGQFAGRVYLEDRMIDFGADDTVVEPLASWRDPLTHATDTTSWHITMSSDAGALELNVDTWSRCLYGFHMLEAYTTHHGALGRASGRYVFPDGRSISFDDCLCYFEEGFVTPLAAG